MTLVEIISFKLYKWQVVGKPAPVNYNSRSNIQSGVVHMINTVWWFISIWTLNDRVELDVKKTFCSFLILHLSKEEVAGCELTAEVR